VTKCEETDATVLTLASPFQWTWSCRTRGQWSCVAAWPHGAYGLQEGSPAVISFKIVLECASHVSVVDVVLCSALFRSVLFEL
jgi:hypothetical protein